MLQSAIVLGQMVLRNGTTTLRRVLEALGKNSRVLHASATWWDAGSDEMAMPAEACAEVFWSENLKKSEGKKLGKFRGKTSWPTKKGLGILPLKFWVSSKVSRQKGVFGLLTPKKLQLEMANVLQKPVFALPECQHFNVCDIWGWLKIVWSVANGGLRDGGLSKSEDIRGKKPFPPVFRIFRCSSHPLEKAEKGRKRVRKADFGRFPGRVARHPLSPNLLQPHLRLAENCGSLFQVARLLLKLRSAEGRCQRWGPFCGKPLGARLIQQSFTNP